MENNSFYTSDELEKIGFKEIGENVLISRKASIYGAESISISNNVRIDDFCILSGKIQLGNYIHISAYSALYGGDKGILVDDYATISSRVSIYALTDDYTGIGMTNPMVDKEFRMVRQEVVKIEKHVIIGATSVVLPGCILKEGSSFGAFSFINKNSEPWSINVGIPFKKINEREKNILDLVKKMTRR